MKVTSIQTVHGADRRGRGRLLKAAGCFLLAVTTLSQLSAQVDDGSGSLPANAATGVPAIPGINPPRGLAPTGLYRIEELETINPATDNLLLQIPLASLPRNTGGGKQFNLSLIYNSRSFDATSGGLDVNGVPEYTLASQANQGWNYNFGYGLELEEREVGNAACTGTGSTSGTRTLLTYAFRLTLVFPDNSRHLLRLTGVSDNQGDGYYPFDPNGHPIANTGCWTGSPATYPVSGGVVQYHTVDGTFLNVAVQPNSSCGPYDPNLLDSTFYSTNTAFYSCVEALNWNIYFSDGSSWSQSGFGPGSGSTFGVQAPDGNFQPYCSQLQPTFCLPLSGGMLDRDLSGYSGTYTNTGGYWTITFQDTTGRTVTIQNSLNGQGSPIDTITESGVAEAPLVSTVVWKSYTGQGHYYLYDALLGPSSFVSQDTVVSTIAVPSQYCNPAPCSLGYSFTYNTDSGGPGLGEVSSMTTPYGATSTYSYSVSNGSNNGTNLSQPLTTDVYLREHITQKILTYGSSSPGGPQFSETTSYSLVDCSPCGGTPQTTNTVTAPDGGITTYKIFFNQPLNATGYDSRSGLIWEVDQPDGSIINRFWMHNDPYGDPASTTAALYNNPFAQTEYTTLSGKMKLKSYQYDPNGNVSAVAEYDWSSSAVPLTTLTQQPIPNTGASGVPSGLSPVRTTQTGYLNATTGNDANSYQNASSPLYRSAVSSKQIVNSSGQTASRTEFSYNAVLAGNPNSVQLTQERHWKTGSLGSCGNQCLTTSNATIRNLTYDGFGNVSTDSGPGVADGSGSPTKYVYDSTGANLVSLTKGYGTPLAETWTITPDPSSGLPLSVSDPNGVSTAFNYDALGRPTSTHEALGTGAERATTIQYSIEQRCMLTQQSLNTTTPLTLASQIHFDGLGRAWLSQQSEGNMGTTCADSGSDTTNGIKVQTQYYNGSLGRAQLASNPYRSTSDPEGTLGWTLTAFDKIGRPVRVGRYAGATAPAWGDTSPIAGLTTMTYDQAITGTNDLMSTVSDPSIRQSVTDGLGRLVTLVEDPNGKDYTTTYVYDTLDDLTGVSQVGGPSGSDLTTMATGACGYQRCFTYDPLKRLVSAANPETTPTSYVYNDNGNPTQRAVTSGATTTYTYDSLNRMSTKSYSGSITPAVTYCYDGWTWSGSFGVCTAGSIPNSVGHLTEVASSASATSYTGFDAMSRITASAQNTAPLGAQQFTYSYNAAGLMTSMVFPSSRTLTWTYDSTGRQQTVGGVLQGQNLQYAGSSGTPITYSPQGAVESLPLGDGVTEATLWNSRLQPVQIIAGPNPSPGQGWLQLNVYYCASHLIDCSVNNGNVQEQDIQAITPGVSGSQSWAQTYAYDGLNRLTSAAEGSNWSQTFRYDTFGNRALLAGSFAQSGAQMAQVSSLSVLPPFSNNQWTGAGYDGVGNQNAVGSATFIYDAENRLKSATEPSMPAISYTYDGDGRRVTKTVGSTTTTYLYDAAGQLASEYGGAAVTPGTSFLTVDWLGSTRLITNQTGQVTGVVSRRDYAPFGEELQQGVGGRGATFGATAYPSVTPNPSDLEFTSKERDAESGLDYFGARYNSSAQGRFTSPDPYEIVVQKNKGGTSQERASLLNSFISNPQAWNKYAYGLNNPLKNIDVGGHCSAPAGLRGGQTGICIEAFIAAKTIGGIGRGDGRDFSATGGTYRFRVDVRVDPGLSGNISINTDAGRSGVILPGLGFRGDGTAGLSGITTDDAGNRTFTVSGSAVNGEQFINKYVPFFDPAPKGDISFDLTFTVTPKGQVTLDKAESRTFPSLEIYNYNSSGALTQKVFTFPEQNSNDLTKPKQCIGGPGCSQ
jgi:RHS repeat-associated protein